MEFFDILSALHAIFNASSKASHEEKDKQIKNLRGKIQSIGDIDITKVNNLLDIPIAIEF